MEFEIRNVLKRAMTVRELVEMLEDFDPEAKVFAKVPYGDYGGTQQAIPVRKSLSPLGDRFLRTTAYSQSGVAIVEPQEDVVAPSDDLPSIVVIDLS